MNAPIFSIVNDFRLIIKTFQKITLNIHYDERNNETNQETFIFVYFFVRVLNILDTHSKLRYKYFILHYHMTCQARSQDLEMGGGQL